MPGHSFIAFSTINRRMIFLLAASHLVWSCVVLGLWSVGTLFTTTTPWWSAGFLALQLYAATQLLLPVLHMHPEQRTRGFYLFWGTVLLASLWLINRLPASGGWQPLLMVANSGLLLLIATVTGAAMARYVKRLWELVPVCIVMTLADFASWLYGPTAGFTEQITEYYLAPEGPPPLVDMILVKLAFPGPAGLSPVFGVSDWIMVVFFAIVARRHGVNDNLAGPSGETLARKGGVGRYLPVPVAALFVAILLAQVSGLFVPALPLIALVMLLWYALRHLLGRRRV